MSGTRPVAVYTLRVPPGDVLIPAVPEFAAMVGKIARKMSKRLLRVQFRLTMAAIDPSAEPELEDADDKRPPRATLKVVRFTNDQFGDDEDESDDEDFLDDDDDDEDSADDEENGGPSDKASKKLRLLEALAADEEDEDEDMDDDDDEDEVDAAEIIKQLTKISKGKGKALNDDDDDDDDDEDEDSDEALELDEVVLCTLDPEKHYNQPLDFVVGDGEKIFFKVSGTHTVHLSGNYLMPVDDGQAPLYDDEDEEYDLSPDEDELDELDALVDGDEESDELDDIEDPRITEIEEEKVVAKPKGKNKRSAEELTTEEDLDALIAKSVKKDEPAVNGEEKKLSKAEKKAAKKLKKNDGEAIALGTPDKKAETNATTNGSEKKTVQFAKNLEQGPTPSATPPVKKDEAKKEEVKKAGANNATLGVRNVNGVTVDDRKIGSGPPAKKNSKVEMRYIGKLESGKVFDSNKSGPPFSFKLGTGQVIKGWDIGLEGISAGGERRVTIPANLAYGNKALPGIPKNSKLIFDVKCLSVK